MAKKRVHEIAKERGIPSKEVLATLQKAGFDVKAAASSVDERDIERAFSDGAGADGAGAADATNGAESPQPAAEARQGGAAGPDPVGRDRQGGRGVAGAQLGRGDQEADGAGRDGHAHPDPV